MTLSHRAAFTFATQIVSYVVIFLGSVIVARTLGVEGKGTYSLVVLVYNLAVPIAGLGIPVFTACFVGQRRHTPSQLFANSLVWAALSVIWLGGLISALMLGSFDTIIGVQREYVVAGLAIAPLGMVIEGLASIAQGSNRIKEYNLLRLANPVASTSLLSLLVLVLRWGPPGAVLSLVLSQLLLITFATILVSPGMGRVEWPLMRNSAAFGMQAWATQLVGLLNLRLAILLVGYFLGAAGLGYFSVAQGLLDLLHFIPIAISTVSLPVFSATGRAQASEVACIGIRHTLMLSALAGIGLIAVGRWVIEWFYTPAFLPALTALWIMIPGVVAYSVAHITTSYFNGQLHRPLLNTAIAAISLVLNGALGLWLIPIWGLAGAAAATTFAYLIAIAINLAMFLQIAGCPLSDMLIPKASDFKAYWMLLPLTKAGAISTHQ
ncbi:MAG: oligosaccharide flippase family protein [Chloroflexi bacterium]|nr:oligosaccharide flippase family protein [Chloroflexota bacterium]MCL5026416.1 oligosaccharide flippase family protein [Chloroflexota bacterium]